MLNLSYSALIGLSYLGTKYIGLERTIRAVERIGKAQKRLLGRRAKQSTDELKRRLLATYRFFPVPIRCLEQAIVTWYALNLQDEAAILKIGMRVSPLESHAWVETPEALFGDIPGLVDMTVMAQYGAWT